MNKPVIIMYKPRNLRGEAGAFFTRFINVGISSKLFRSVSSSIWRTAIAQSYTQRLISNNHLLAPSIFPETLEMASFMKKMTRKGKEAVEVLSSIQIAVVTRFRM
jgi:hypothetical protein